MNTLIQLQNGGHALLDAEGIELWRNPSSREEIETALDAHKLYVAMNGRGAAYWLARRNGRTQTWKTRPDEYRIPVKAGLRATGQLTPQSIPATLRIAASNKLALMEAC